MIRRCLWVAALYFASLPLQAHSQALPGQGELLESEMDGSTLASPPAASAGLTEGQVREIIEQYLGTTGSPPETAWFAEPVRPAPAAPVTYPTAKLTGFFQLDSVRFDQDATSLATLGDIQDGTGFRRARLAAVGNLSETASYCFEFDIAQAQARFVDVWGQFSDSPLGNVRIGRFRQPFGMSELTSARELPFVERPSAFALGPFRQTGIMLFDTAMNEQATWAMSGFRTISDNFGNVYGDSGGYGTAIRTTFLPVDCGDEGLVHLGFDHSYLDPARNAIQYASQNEVLVGQNPNFGPGGLSVLPLDFVPPFVQSGVFPVDHVHLFNLEAAASVGRALVQSEFRWAHVSLPTGDQATVPALYVHGRYMLTDDIIPYNRTGGVFGRVSPRNPVKAWCGQWGAWELASQISYIDLNDLSAQPAVPGPGRRMTNGTLGLNWYLLTNAKMHFQYIATALDDPTSGDSTTHTYASMVQFDF
ncbi:MAG: OprO/OprP family phosphate-selective porin [Planctomycetaceae bacterium]